MNGQSFGAITQVKIPPPPETKIVQQSQRSAAVKQPLKKHKQLTKKQRTLSNSSFQSEYASSYMSRAKASSRELS